MSFVLKKIASTTADVANVHAKNGIITLSYPKVITLLIYTGMNPQCIPKMTRICQVRPTIPPASIGLTLLTANVKCEINVEPNVATGPSSKMATGKVTNNVSIGTKKNFTKSGINLLKSFSHFEANHTAKITGMTVPV